MRPNLRLSLIATLAGWATATLLTLPFELPELWRNAAPGLLVPDLLEGSALWAAFTLAVCTGVWCVVVLPIALWVPAQPIVRRRWLTAAACAVAGVLLVGWRLGTWLDLARHSPINPVTASLFLEYATFAASLASVTTLTYTRLVRQRPEP